MYRWRSITRPISLREIRRAREFTSGNELPFRAMLFLQEPNQRNCLAVGTCCDSHLCTAQRFIRPYRSRVVGHKGALRKLACATAILSGLAASIRATRLQSDMRDCGLFRLSEMLLIRENSRHWLIEMRVVQLNLNDVARRRGTPLNRRAIRSPGRRVVHREP